MAIENGPIQQVLLGDDCGWLSGPEQLSLARTLCDVVVDLILTADVEVGVQVELGRVDGTLASLRDREARAIGHTEVGLQGLHLQQSGGLVLPIRHLQLDPAWSARVHKQDSLLPEVPHG